MALKNHNLLAQCEILRRELRATTDRRSSGSEEAEREFEHAFDLALSGVATSSDSSESDF